MIVILDFGSQYTQLIARRIREQHVYCEIHPFNISLDTIKEKKPEGIILSGGPSSVLGEESPTIDPAIFEWSIPVLGICYGLQLMSSLLGGAVESSGHSEYGRMGIRFLQDDVFFKSIPTQENLTVWMSHGDRVIELPPSFRVLADSENCPFAAVMEPERKLYGIQFHPEVTHTVHGIQILRNFIFEICQCQPDWNMDSFLETKTAEIRQQVGDEKVLCALSGGVDSSVTAVLLHEAIGDNLVCIFVDNGLLRKGEAERVVTLFKKHYHINLIHIDATQIFWDKLKGVVDPEKNERLLGMSL